MVATGLGRSFSAKGPRSSSRHARCPLIHARWRGPVGLREGEAGTSIRTRADSLPGSRPLPRTKPWAAVPPYREPGSARPDGILRHFGGRRRERARRPAYLIAWCASTRNTIFAAARCSAKAATYSGVSRGVGPCPCAATSFLTFGRPELIVAASCSNEFSR